MQTEFDPALTATPVIIRSQTARFMVFMVIMAGLASQNLLFSVLPPALPSMAFALGRQGAMVSQLLFVLPSLGLMIAGLASGWIIDRVGLRRTLIPSVLLYGLAGSLPVISANIPLLLGSRLLLGMACATLSTSCTLLLALTYTGDERSRVLGYQAGASNIAGLAALVIAGAVTGPLGWHAPFAFYGVLAIIILVFVLFALPSSNTPAAAGPIPHAAQSAGGNGGTVVKFLWPAYLSAGLLITIAIASGAALPFVLQERGITKSLDQSLIVACFTIFAAIGAFTFGRLNARFGPRATLAASIAISGIGMVLIGLSRSSAPTVIGESLGGLGLGAFVPFYWMITTNAFSNHLRGRAVGFLNTAMFFGGFLAAFIIAGLNRLFGHAGAFTAIGIGAIAFALLVTVVQHGVLTGKPANS